AAAADLHERRAVPAGGGVSVLTRSRVAADLDQHLLRDGEPVLRDDGRRDGAVRGEEGPTDGGEQHVQPGGHGIATSRHDLPGADPTADGGRAVALRDRGRDVRCVGCLRVADAADRGRRWLTGAYMA